MCRFQKEISVDVYCQKPLVSWPSLSSNISANWPVTKWHAYLSMFSDTRLSALYCRISPMQVLHFCPCPCQYRLMQRALINCLCASQFHSHHANIQQLGWPSWSRCLEVKVWSNRFHSSSKNMLGCVFSSCQFIYCQLQLLGMNVGMVFVIVCLLEQVVPI